MPSAYFKDTEVVRQRKSPASHGKDMSGFHHLIRHRLIQPHVDQVAFESGLRSFSQDELMLEKERGWNGLPNIKHHESPRILSRKSYNKFKGLETGDFESAYDGYVNFPQYEGKVRERNLAGVRHLVRADPLLPTLDWEMSLREGSPRKV